VSVDLILGTKKEAIPASDAWADFASLERKDERTNLQRNSKKKVSRWWKKLEGNVVTTEGGLHDDKKKSTHWGPQRKNDTAASPPNWVGGEGRQKFNENGRAGRRLNNTGRPRFRGRIGGGGAKTAEGKNSTEPCALRGQNSYHAVKGRRTRTHRGSALPGTAFLHATRMKDKGGCSNMPESERKRPLVDQKMLSKWLAESTPGL